MTSTTESPARELSNPHAAHTATDYRLVDVMSSTLRAVFPYVYVLDLPRSASNAVIFGCVLPITEQQLKARLLRAGDPHLEELAGQDWTLQAVPKPTIVYTDDLAPVERLIDDMIIREALAGRGRKR